MALLAGTIIYANLMGCIWGPFRGWFMRSVARGCCRYGCRRRRRAFAVLSPPRLPVASLRRGADAVGLIHLG